MTFLEQAQPWTYYSSKKQTKKNSKKKKEKKSNNIFFLWEILPGQEGKNGIQVTFININGLLSSSTLKKFPKTEAWINFE